MADWLKVRHVLVRSPKIRGLMRALRCKRHTALGLALDWLVWIDEQTDDGKTHLLPDELADEIGFRGCAEALIEIGWAALGSDGCVEAVEFGKHCGDSAKKRAENALRKARSRMSGEKCHAKSVTDVTHGVTQMALPEKKRKEYNMVSGNTTVDLGAGGGAAAPPPHVDMTEGFRQWLAAMCGCVPQLRAFRVLPEDVVQAAQEAYGCLPDAAVYVELLTAYYADRMQEDRRRVAFWRPMGAQFFCGLGDVIFKHAQRWQKETGWRKKAAKTHENASETASNTPSGQLQRTGGKRALEAYQERMNEHYGIKKGGDDR